GFRYEAYANYNLGYTLVQLGRCSDALPYLNRSEQLQGYRSEIADATAAAQRCLSGPSPPPAAAPAPAHGNGTRQGNNGNGNGNGKGDWRAGAFPRKSGGSGGRFPPHVRRPGGALLAAELEDPKAAPNEGAADVVDGPVAHPPLEAAGVGMPVED